MPLSFDDNLWGPLNLDDWRQVPHIKGRLADQLDVKEGRAVFYIEPNESNHSTLGIQIPSLAKHSDEETNEISVVILIQAEKVDEQELVGFRKLAGGNGICLLEELELMDD